MYRGCDDLIERIRLVIRVDLGMSRDLGQLGCGSLKTKAGTHRDVVANREAARKRRTFIRFPFVNSRVLDTRSARIVIVL